MPRLTPTPWPQDSVKAPFGGGIMPTVERENRALIGQESFELSAEFTILNGSAAGSILHQIVPTDQDGDFYCEQIFAYGQDTTGLTNIMRALTVEIFDVRTGISLTRNDALPIQFLNGAAINEAFGFSVGNFPLPSGFRPIGTLFEPFCFTRSGGIDITLQNIYAASFPTARVTIAFAGWKEYAHASR